MIYIYTYHIHNIRYTKIQNITRDPAISSPFLLGTFPPPLLGRQMHHTSQRWSHGDGDHMTSMARATGPWLLEMAVDMAMKWLFP